MCYRRGIEWGNCAMSQGGPHIHASISKCQIHYMEGHRSETKVAR